VTVGDSRYLRQTRPKKQTRSAKCQTMRKEIVRIETGSQCDIEKTQGSRALHIIPSRRPARQNTVVASVATCRNRRGWLKTSAQLGAPPATHTEVPYPTWRKRQSVPESAMDLKIAG
jgi:hypothetical protein